MHVCTLPRARLGSDLALLGAFGDLLNGQTMRGYGAVRGNEVESTALGWSAAPSSNTGWKRLNCYCLGGKWPTAVTRGSEGHAGSR